MPPVTFLNVWHRAPGNEDQRARTDHRLLAIHAKGIGALKNKEILFAVTMQMRRRAFTKFGVGDDRRKCPAGSPRHRDCPSMSMPNGTDRLRHLGPGDDRRHVSSAALVDFSLIVVFLSSLACSTSRSVTSSSIRASIASRPAINMNCLPGNQPAIVTDQEQACSRDFVYLALPANWGFRSRWVGGCRNHFGILYSSVSMLPGEPSLTGTSARRAPRQGLARTPPDPSWPRRHLPRRCRPRTLLRR